MRSCSCQGRFSVASFEERFLRHFEGVPLFGLNLSLPEGLDSWNPFDALWERDSSRTARPDLVFLSDTPSVPVVGVCKVEPYPGGLTDATDPAMNALLAGRHAAVVTINTRLDVNEVGLRTPAEVESLISRTDALVTTRLHGLVLALKRRAGRRHRSGSRRRKARAAGENHRLAGLLHR